MRIDSCRRDTPALAKPHARRAIALGAAALLATVLGSPPAAQAVPVVSSHLKVLVPAGGGLVDLFTLPVPAACMPSPCTEQRVMMAKFVVDETASDLSFELRPVLSPISKYPVTPFSTAGGGPNVSVSDNDLGVQALTVRARFTTELTKAGFKVLTILVRFDNAYDSFPVGESFRIQANPTPGDDHYYGFRVDGATEVPAPCAATATTLSQAECLITKPHLINYITDAQLTNFALFVPHANPTTINFGGVHINLADEYLPDEFYEFRNVGTAPLNVTAATPAPSGAYTIENFPLPPVNVLPMDVLQRRITCKPTALGPIANASVTLTTNAGSLQLDLSGARGIRLNSAILFDLSGSMLEDKVGNFPVAEAQQKVDAARFAALQLSEVYNLILPTARLGLYSYPNLAGVTPSSQDHVPLTVIGASNNIDGYRARLNRTLGNPLLIKPIGMQALTPMAEGIKRVWEVLTPVKDANNRAAVFQIGDGQHYGDSAPPRPTPADWYNSSTFQNGGIPFFTVPYGPTGAGWLQTFQQLSGKSGGTTFPADVTDDVALQTEFIKALGDALDLETLKDPEASIAAGGKASHPVCVTTSTYQLVFSVHWAEQDASAVTVTVETPDHTVLTPASPAAHPGHVSYSSGLTFADYVVRGKFLSGDAGAGVWRVRITGNKATTYVYQVQAMDRMKSEPTFDLAYIGHAAHLSLKYLAGPHAVAGASLIARYEKPSASFNNYLATTRVTPEMIARVPEKLAASMTLAEKKAYALAHFADKPFTARRVVEEFRVGELERSALEEAFSTERAPLLRPAAHPAVLGLSPTMTASTEKRYQLSLPAARFDGLHKLSVAVKGITAREQCFEREYVFSRVADLRLTSALMRAALRWEEARPKPFFEPDLLKLLEQAPERGMRRMSVTFTPVDKAGNYWGVGRADEVRFAVKGARTLGHVMDNLDGSYTQVVEFRAETRPLASVVVGDARSPALPLPLRRPTPVGPTPVRPTPR